MLVALTGGTGFLGRHLIDALRHAGHRVRVLVRGLEGRGLSPRDRVEYCAGALDDPAALSALSDGADAIVHTAFSEEPSTFIATNVSGTLQLLEASAAAGIPFIFSSSLAVYGSDPNADPRGADFRRDEDYPLWPTEVYGAHKAALEKLIFAVGASLGSRISVFRLGWVLGEQEHWEKNAFAPQVDEALADGVLRTPRGGYVIDVQDAAALLAQAVADERFAGGVFNSFDRWLDFSDVAPILGKQLGRTVATECPASRPPRTPIENGRLLAQGVEFQTDQRIEELLARLLRRRQGSANAPEGQ